MVEYTSKYQNKTEGANKLLEDKLMQNSRDIAIFKTDKGKLAIYYPPCIADVALDYSNVPYADVIARLFLRNFGLGIERKNRIR